MKMIEIILDFGKLELYDEFVVIRMCPEHHYSKESNLQVKAILKDHFIEGTPYSIIHLRDGETSIDPISHQINALDKDLCSVAIVETNQVAISTSEFEKQFFKPGLLQSFLKLEDAVQWCQNILMVRLKKMNSIFLF